MATNGNNNKGRQHWETRSNTGIAPSESILAQTHLSEKKLCGNCRQSTKVLVFDGLKNFDNGIMSVMNSTDVGTSPDTSDNVENNNRWVIYNQKEQPYKMFDEWLDTNLPSKYASSCGVKWKLCVRRKRKNTVSVLGDEQLRLLRLECDEIKKSGTPVDPENVIKDLAIKYKATQGKLMLFPKITEEADYLWKLVASGIIRGDISSSHAAKISGPLPQDLKTMKQNPGMEKHIADYVIEIYTDNFADKTDVYKCRDELRFVGIDQKLCYKPNIYTIFGIFKYNEHALWGLKPTLNFDN